MRSRLHLLSSLAITTTLALACHPREPSKAVDPPAPPSIAEIVEWLVGEQVRSPKTSNRGVGLVILDFDAKALGEGTLAPGSCAPSIVSVISIPRTPDEWLGVDETPTLHRYSRDGWTAVPSKIRLRPLGKLLAIAHGSDGSLLVLVYEKGDNKQLWQLTLSAGAVTGIQAVEPKSFRDRRTTLAAYDSGRCRGLDDCLHLTSIGQDVVLSVEPKPYDFWQTKLELGPTGARDVRYVGDDGKKIGLLIAEPCKPPADATPPAATPSPATEAPPTPSAPPASPPTSPPPGSAPQPKHRP
jgi:hypothetical protein